LRFLILLKAVDMVILTRWSASTPWLQATSWSIPAHPARQGFYDSAPHKPTYLLTYTNLLICLLHTLTHSLAAKISQTSIDGYSTYVFI